MPLTCAHWPVSRHARLPEHDGAAQKAWRNSSPWSASRWMFGVGDLVAVGLDVAARVVRVEVDDVRRHSVYSPLSTEKLWIYVLRPPDQRLSRVRHAAERQHAAVRDCCGPPASPATRSSTSRSCAPLGRAAPAARVLRGRRGLPRARSPRVAAPAGAGPRGRVGAGVVGAHPAPTVRRPTASGAASSCGATSTISRRGPARCPASPARTSTADPRRRSSATSAARVRHAGRQGRPGRLAVARGADPVLASRGRTTRRRPTASRTSIEGIDHLRRQLEADDAAWRGWFAAHGREVARGVLRGPRGGAARDDRRACSRSSGCRRTVCPSRTCAARATRAREAWAERYRAEAGVRA